MEPLTYEQRVDLIGKSNMQEQKAKKAKAKRRRVVQKASRKANRRK